jgi:hypothetical protein
MTGRHFSIRCPALVVRLVTAEEHRVMGGLKRKGGPAALKRYYDGK